jgi:hypothetical protein
MWGLTPLSLSLKTDGYGVFSSFRKPASFIKANICNANATQMRRKCCKYTIYGLK